MNKKLSFKEIIIVSSTLFGMFFGAGNLIFPVHLGQLAGSNSWAATLGFIITAVTIPILGVSAIGITHSDGLQDLASKVGKKYAVFFTCLLYLTIGPFFAIPRCATVSFTVGVEPILSSDANAGLILFIFSLVFFALVLFFSLRPGKITIWIGKIINPAFLITLFVIIIISFINPISKISDITPQDSYLDGAFFNGFIEGYGTMDAIAGLAFGIIVVEIIRNMGVNSDKAIAKDVLKSGIFTAILMAIIYILTIVLGAQSMGEFELSANGGIALYQITNYYLGNFGSILLAIMITLACLKTSIGLVTSCSETFKSMFKGCKLTYKAWCVIFTVFSFLVSNVGLTSIINYSLPVLMFIYPLAISLIILALFGKFFDHSKVVYVFATIFTLIPAIFDLIKTLPTDIIKSFNLNPIIYLGAKIFPFFNIGLGWLVSFLVGTLIGLIVYFCKKKKATC